MTFTSFEDILEEVYEEYKSDEEVLAEWIGSSIFLIPENAKSPNYLKELLSTSLARRLLETFNLDVSKIKNKV